MSRLDVGSYLTTRQRPLRASETGPGAPLLTGTETGFGGVVFGLLGIPGLILMCVGAGMWLVDRATQAEGTGMGSRSNTARKLFLLGLVMFSRHGRACGDRCLGLLSGFSPWSALGDPAEFRVTPTFGRGSKAPIGLGSQVG